MARRARPLGVALRSKAAKNAPLGHFLHAAYPFGFESRFSAMRKQKKKLYHFDTASYVVEN